MADLVEEELAKRLSLYQVFLSLYRKNTILINDILQWEDNCHSTNREFTQLYVQGIVDTPEICVITNISTGETQKLLQSQQIWTIGRNPSNGICIADPYLSNCHGAIQYCWEDNSFYLIDFNSTNGSYINGEPIYQPTRLKDSDRVRLGKLTLSFYVTHSSSTLPKVPVDFLTQFKSEPCQIDTDDEQLADAEATFTLLKKSDQMENIDSLDNISSTHEQRSNILDNFFSRRNNTKNK
ncbi:MAG: FHA domain-containing protein [Richelia sp.]|nr:FHA domain-containing protein [Richelia sp.]CDN13117.1 Adenylate cyclase [Richelia intracellularis]